MTEKRLGCILALISGILYGLMPLVTKTIYSAGSNPYTAVFMRMVIGSVVFYTLFKVTTGKSLAVSRKELKQLIICGLGYGITPLLLYISYTYLASGLATTLHFVYPVFVVIGSILFKTQKMTRRKLLCCFLCMCGILAFYTPGGAVSLKGIVIALSSGIVYAFYTVYLEASDLLTMDPYKLACWKHLISVILIGIFAGLTRNFAWPAAAGWGFMLILGLMTAASSFLYQIATKKAGAPVTAMLSTFEPLTSVFVGYFAYGEALTLRSAAGIVFILLSVILLSTEGMKKRG